LQKNNFTEPNFTWEKWWCGRKNSREFPKLNDWRFNVKKSI
jgi:hypothetical protein